jgi:hypothetical protein
MDDNKGEHSKEVYLVIEEWNYHEHHEKGEIHGEWKK